MPSLSPGQHRACGETLHAAIFPWRPGLQPLLRDVRALQKQAERAARGRLAVAVRQSGPIPMAWNRPPERMAELTLLATDPWLSVPLVLQRPQTSASLGIAAAWFWACDGSGAPLLEVELEGDEPFAGLASCPARNGQDEESLPGVLPSIVIAPRSVQLPPPICALVRYLPRL